MKRGLLLVALALAGCGEAVKDDHFTRNEAAAEGGDAGDSAAPAMVPGAVPVRIGELGPNFDACGTAATTRHLGAGGQLPVRSAPFDAAATSGQVAAGAQFFICTRSIDQRWFGIVYRDDGTLAAECGVSSPVDSRRAYEGPCRSGWVSSAFVKLIAG